MGEEKKLAKKDSNVPTFLNSQEIDLDLMNVDSSELRVSGLDLCQPTTDFVQEGKAKLGDFVDRITEQNFGPEIEIIVLKRDKVWLKFGKEGDPNLRSEDGRFWDDGKPLSKEDEWKCACHNFYVLVRNHLQELPNRLSFRGTAYREGDNLLNQIVRFAKMGVGGQKTPVHARAYKVKSEQRMKNNHKFFVPIVSCTGFVTEDEYKYASKVIEELKKRKVVSADEEIVLHPGEGDADGLAMD